MQDALGTMGGLYLAVNCAGVGWPKRLVGKDGPMPGEFFRKVIEVNLVGTLLVRQVVENPMLNGETIRLDGSIRMAPR